MIAKQHNNKIDQKEANSVTKESLAVEELNKAIKENEKLSKEGGKMYSQIVSGSGKKNLNKKIKKN